MTKFMPAPMAKHDMAIPKPLSDLIGFSDRLCALLHAETEALRAGAKDALKKHEADKAKIMALYQRDLNALRKESDWAKRLDAKSRAAMTAAGERLHAALKSQSDLIARRKHVTEGIVQAIAKEVSAKRQVVSPYAKPQGGRPAPASSIMATAITLNSVV